MQCKIAHLLPQIRGPRRDRPVCVVEGPPAAPVGPSPSSFAVAVAVDVLDVVLELEPARDVDERGQGEDEEGLDVAVSESAKKGGKRGAAGGRNGWLWRQPELCTPILNRQKILCYVDERSHF